MKSKSIMTPTPQELIFRKNDPLDPRLGDLCRVQPSPQPPAVGLNFSIWSYPDDLGISNGGGRPGAAQGPERIRKALYKMTPQKSWLNDNIHLHDHGDLILGEDKAADHDPLVVRHRRAQDFMQCQFSMGQFPITLGGGHDYGYPDVKGWLLSLPPVKDSQLKPIVINFDAHLDVRPWKEGQPLSSGTPFFRILEEFAADIEFIEIGIQPFSHSAAHRDYVLKMGGKIIDREDLAEETKWSEQLNLQNYAGRPVFLSLDMDVFSSAVAPGCSQSFPTGVEARELLAVWRKLFRFCCPSALGIYEVSPTYDHDDQTAKLAAIMIYEFINYHANHLAQSQQHLEQLGLLLKSTDSAKTSLGRP